MRLRSRKLRQTILETNLLLRLVKSKRKRIFAQSLTITELRNFLRLELEITGEEMASEKRVLKKNNLIRPANRKTRMLFCQEKRNWTKEDWKKLFFSDETMVVIKNACKIQIWGKSDKKHVPHLICCEDKKQVAVMFWGCVSSRGEEALIPVLGTIDSVKYIDIFQNYLIPSLTWYFGNHNEFFQQDNASCHALRIVMEHLDENDIFTQYWPPQSPDLNITGNIWDMITRKLHKNTKFIKSEQNVTGCFLA